MLQCVEAMHIKSLLVVTVRRPAGKGPLRISKPKAKGGGLGVKKMTTKVDDSLYDQAPAEAAIAPPPPIAVVCSSMTQAMFACHKQTDARPLLQNAHVKTRSWQEGSLNFRIMHVDHCAKFVLAIPGASELLYAPLLTHLHQVCFVKKTQWTPHRRQNH